MLVMLPPSFDGSSDAYTRLARATGLLAYDLKTRVKPGVWSVVRSLGDETQASELAARLEAQGFEAFAVPRDVAHDPSRRIVTIRALEFGVDQITIALREREMSIPFGALTCIVRGEVHLGQVPARAVAPGSSGFPGSADIPVFRESLSPSNFESFAAADLHFATVLWVARIDARSFDFAASGERTDRLASDLDLLVDRLAERSAVRVDRGVRASSVVSALLQMANPRATPISQAPRSSREGPSDERFDPYSRVIAEAERMRSHALRNQPER